MLKMRVVTNEGKQITFKQSLIRNFSRMIDGLPFFNLAGMISISKSPVKQRVGDKLAGTVVVLVGFN
jgi:uncharacterized RDD family membrane protein YckC